MDWAYSNKKKPQLPEPERGYKEATKIKFLPLHYGNKPTSVNKNQLLIDS